MNVYPNILNIIPIVSSRLLLQRNKLGHPEMTEKLPNTWSDSPVVIDAMNVAGSTKIPGCSNFCWGRVEAIRTIWKNEVDPDASFVMVVDVKRARKLGPCCKRKYRTERETDAVKEFEWADPEILRIAEETEAAVLTQDFYKDKDLRERHPWLDGNRSQFFEWIVEAGVVRIAVRDMGIPSEFSKTRAQEQAELRGKGADVKKPQVERALRQRYRCDTESGCWLHDYDRGHYTGVPNLKDPDQPRCTVCSEPLTVLGETPRLVQLKFGDVARTRLERRTFSPGLALVIGRDTSDELAAKVLVNDIGLLSRQHAKIEWDGSELLITDLASKNGTTLRRWDRKKRDYQPEVEVRGVVSIRPRDEIRLADVLVITRSARNFTFESETMINQGATSVASTVTQDPQSI